MMATAEEMVFDYFKNNNLSVEIENVTKNGTDNGTSLSDYAFSFPTELIPVVVIYGLTFILGVIGNVLVIFSIAWYKRMRNITNLFLLSLAGADLLLVILCVPIKLAVNFSFTWEFGEAVCKLVHYMQNVSMICSVLTLTAMSLERYYAILHPIEARHVCTKRHAKLVCIAVWVASFVMATPILIGQTHLQVGKPPVVGYWCLKDWSAQHWDILYEVYMLLVIFCIPVGVMVFAYCNIISEVWVVTGRRASMRSGEANGISLPCKKESIPMTDMKKNKRQKNSAVGHRQPNAEDVSTRKQVIKILVAVIVLYIICWGPVLFNNLLTAVGVLRRLNYGYLKPMRQAFYIMSYFNSCVNPIVYGFMSKNFRKSFKQTLCMCWCDRQSKNTLKRTCVEQTTYSSTVTRWDSTAAAAYHKPESPIPSDV
ncbi:G-protein coupled receptor 54 [Lingula anatina]|uniref:G-protein coupled receptor 54 n=1 Tax=Lingula anatina TaxID=7574 RepID=A0A1S3JTN6_LINAN|nr:G-protein coupled receptor 54 [Lingula anatina]|eukprot:XP_013413429.1 G-protein coupled receptor 54 [Lingula anatina]